MILPHQCPPL